MRKLSARKWNETLKPAKLVPQEKQKPCDRGYSSGGPHFLRLQECPMNKSVSSFPHKSRTVPWDSAATKTVNGFKEFKYQS